MNRPILPRAIGSVLLLMGGLFMFGWLLRTPEILRPFPGILMVFNTALCFALAGLALLADGLADSRRRPIQSALGAAMVFLGSAVLAQYVFAVDLGIDWPRLHSWIIDSNRYPGRMAEMTCVAFILSGAVLILQQRVTTLARVHLVRGFCFAVGAIGAMSITGQILGLHQMFDTYLLAQISMSAAFGFVALSAGLWAGWRRESWNMPLLFKSETGQILLASGTTMIATAVMCAVAGFLVLQSNAEKLLGLQLTHELGTWSARFTQVIDRHMAEAGLLTAQPTVSDRLAAIADTPRAVGDRQSLQAFAEQALAAGFSAVTAVDPRGAIIVNAGSQVTTPEFSLSLRRPHSAKLLWTGQYLLSTETAITDRGRVLGKIILQQPLPDLLKLLGDSGKTKAGGTLEICALKDRVIACAPTRIRQQPLYMSRIRGNRNPTPIVLALEGASGIIKVDDYRGSETIAAYAPLGTFGLGIVLQQNTAAFYAPIREQLMYLLLPIVALLLAGSLVVLRSLILPLARKLAISEQRLQLALDGSHLALWDWDLATNKVYLSPQWQQLLGGKAQPTVTTFEELSHLVHPEDFPALRAHLREVLKGLRPQYDAEHRVRTRSGEWKWVHSMGKIVTRAANGRARRLTGTNADVDDRKQAQLQLEHQARHDMLTGLPNRVLLYDRLRQEMARGHRYHRLMAVLYLDIDRFKHINDTFGHAAGDALLKGFAQRLSDCVRTTDTVARLAGDEFFVLLDELHSRDEGRAIAQKIVESMRPAFALESSAVNVTTSVGIAFFDGSENVSGDALITKADQALYRAKASGRDTYREAE